MYNQNSICIGEVKLADFGLARTFPSHCPAKAQGDLKSNMGGGGQGFVRPKYTTDVRMTLKVVTLWYRAPELLLGAYFYPCLLVSIVYLIFGPTTIYDRFR